MSTHLLDQGAAAIAAAVREGRTGAAQMFAEADARRVLALKREIAALDQLVEPLTESCESARRLRTIPGFGPTLQRRVVR